MKDFFDDQYTITLPVVRCKDCANRLMNRCRNSWWSNCKLQKVGNGLKRVKPTQDRTCILFKHI